MQRIAAWSAPCARLLAPCILPCLVAAPSLGQRVMVPHNRPHAQVALVNIRAGALVDGAWIDVYATGNPTPGNNALKDAELVGDEVWIASSFWIYRYEARGDRNFIDSFPVQDPVRSIEAQSSAQGHRVIVTTTDALLLYDTDANPLGHIHIHGAGDTLELEDSMLVAIQDDNRIDRYTFSGQWLSTFAGPSLPSPLGILSEPLQLSCRRNGNILVAGDVRVYEFLANGDFVGEYDVGPFEGGVTEAVSGQLFVPLQNGVSLYDTRTQLTTSIGGLYFGQGRRVGYYDDGTRLVLRPGEWASNTTCRGAEHSGNDRARMGILGSPQLREESLAIFVDRTPPLAQTLLMMSRDQALTPFGSIGNLCLDRKNVVFVGAPERSDASGQALFTVVRGPEVMIALGGGSTWFAQALYRDGAQMKLSSAITFTLKP
ncbi:MAG: hypothetical protein ACJA2W_001189 [Planctomycetota bacterium]|jgi:hypothetical protein